MSRELSRSKQQVKRLKDSLNKRRFIYEWKDGKFHFISIYLVFLLIVDLLKRLSLSCLRRKNKLSSRFPKVIDRFGTMAINLKACENLRGKDLKAVETSINEVP